MGSETLGLRSVSRLQSRVSLGREKEGVTNYTAGPERCRVQGPGAHPWPAPRHRGFPGDPSFPGSRSTCGCCLPSSFLKLVFLGTGCRELGRGGAVLGSRSGLAFSDLGGDLKFQSSPGGSLDLKHLEGGSPDSASGCAACRRRCWGRTAAFQASSLYGSRRPHLLPPAAGKVGGGRGRAGGLPRPLRHPSGGRGVIHPSNGLGCGEWGRLWGADQQDRKSTAADLPHPPGPRALLASLSLLEPLRVMFWGSLVSASRKK